MYRAFLFFKVEPGHENDVLKRLRNNKNVEEFYLIYGFYDVAVKIKSKTAEGLRSVKKQIKNYDDVDEWNFITHTVVFT